MLFKNLPTSSLFTTIPTRLVLDGVAAFTFLNKEKGFNMYWRLQKHIFHFILKYLN